MTKKKNADVKVQFAERNVFSMEEQVRKASVSLLLENPEAAYKAAGKEFVPNHYTQFWATRERAVLLFQRAALALSLEENREEDDKTPMVSPNLIIWRNSFAKGEFVTRHIIATAIENNALLRLSQIEEVCRGGCERKTVSKVFRRGVDLGLLEKLSGGYKITEKLWNEMLARALASILNKDIVDLAKYVVSQAANHEELLKTMKLKTWVKR